MAKTSNTNNQNVVLLVNAEPKMLMQLHQDMPDWLWVEAPGRWPFAKETEPVAQAFQAIIVFAKQGTEARALAICKQICEKKLLDGVPLLVAGSRYQMFLGHAVKRLPRGSFAFMPIEKNALLNKLKESQGKEL